MTYDRRKKTAATPNKSHPLVKTAATTRTANWWVGAPLPHMGEHFGYNDPSKWAGLTLLQKAFEGGPAVNVGNWDGNLRVHAKHLLEKTKEILKVRTVRRQNESFMLVSDTTMIVLNFDGNGKSGTAKIATTDDTIYRTANMLYDRCLVPDNPKEGLVFTLAKGPMGYDITRLGVAGLPVERGNYSENVLTDYDHVVNDLNAESPCGRLTVLAGEPGTGKTYLVRSLLQDVPRAAFIIIPPHMIEELTAPEILPALTSAKRQMDGPIILILEDGDRVLVPRESGDMSAISSLLNLGDGILGSVLDIRLLVTTNARKVKMDPATRRKGRLCRYIEVDALPAKRAIEALHRLTGKAHPFKEPTTIADVYWKARELGWDPPKDKAGPQSPAQNIRPEIL